jgi:4-carboxymuconolactone decarboxylase
MNEIPNHAAVARRSSSDTDGDVQRVLTKLEARSVDLTILRILANSPRSFRPFVLLADALLDGTVLPARVREAVVLRIAHSRGYIYEWNEHVPIAQSAGLSEALIAGIKNDEPTQAIFDAEQQLGVSAAEELARDGELRNETWQRMNETWGLEGALQLVLVIGWWGGMVPAVTNSLGLVRPDSP